MQNLQNQTFELPQHVAIIGFGLMGGSLALALRSGVSALTAVDTSPEVCAMALSRGFVDRATTDMNQGVSDADLIVLATPVRTILDVVGRLAEARPDGCTVIDLGSTKRDICAALGRLPEAFGAVGGHPMCGKETGGLIHADRALYRGQTFILCETARTTPAARAHALAVVAAAGSRPLWLVPAEHDHLTAVASHLPYLLSALLMERAAVTAARNSNFWQVSASGFRDTGRLAGSDPRMMGDILRTNRDMVVDQLAAFEKSAADLRRLLENNHHADVEAWLAARQAEYRSYRQQIEERL